MYIQRKKSTSLYLISIMKNPQQIKFEKKIFMAMFTITLVIVNVFTCYISFSDAKTNIELITARVVNVINRDMQNNRIIASTLGTMLQLPDSIVNKKLQINIDELAGTRSNDPQQQDTGLWSPDIDYPHRKKFTILRAFWQKFSDSNKSSFTTYYTDGDTGYYYLPGSQKAVKIHGNNPHFRLSDYIDEVSSLLKNTDKFIVPAPFYSNVYEDSITKLPTITIGSPVIVNVFSSIDTEMSGIIATDYTQHDLSRIFAQASNDLHLKSKVYEIFIHSRKPNDINMQISAPRNAGFSINVKNIELTKGFYLNARIYLSELIRIKLAGFIITNIVMAFFFLIFLKAHKNINLMMNKLTVDSLTQALSREGGEIIVQNLPASKATALVAIDLNDFKTINDTWGHHAGDRALVFFSQYFLHSIRQDDYLIRMGGDEFILMLHNVTLSQADDIMTKLCQGLSGFHFEDSFIPLSFSYGISDFAGGFIASYKQADEELYQMKKRKNAASMPKSQMSSANN